MTETLLKSILFGFGVYTMVMIVLRPLLPEKHKSLIEEFDNSACIITPLIALIYLGVWISTLLGTQNTFEEPNGFQQIKSSWVSVSYLSYLPQVIIVLSSQLLWFKRLRSIILIRFLIALLLMIPTERFLTYIAISADRDYLPSSWSVSLSDQIKDWIGCLCLFVLMIAFSLIEPRLKHRCKKLFESIFSHKKGRK